MLSFLCVVDRFSAQHLHNAQPHDGLVLTRSADRKKERRKKESVYEKGARMLLLPPKHLLMMIDTTEYCNEEGNVNDDTHVATANTTTTTTTTATTATTVNHPFTSITDLHCRHPLPNSDDESIGARTILLSTPYSSGSNHRTTTTAAASTATT